MPRGGREFKPIILLPAAFIFLLISVVLALLASKIIKGRRVKGIPHARDYELELNRLNDEKKSIEDMIKLAQLKFHKHKLDEESFREIVRDQQKRLIEIEAKTKDLERRMMKLEERAQEK